MDMCKKNKFQRKSRMFQNLRTSLKNRSTLLDLKVKEKHIKGGSSLKKSKDKHHRSNLQQIFGLLLDPTIYILKC
jgi:hypothetical protein